MEKVLVRPKAQHFLQAVLYTLNAIPIIPTGTRSSAILILSVPVGTCSTGKSEDTTPSLFKVHNINV